MRKALRNDETGSVSFPIPGVGEYFFTYVPMESVDGWFLLSVVPAEEIQGVTDGILHSTNVAVLFLGVVLISCIAFFVLIMRTQKDLGSKDRTIQYQSRLFNVLTDYISRCTDDVYILVEQGASEPEFLSGNAERVLGVKPEKIVPRLQAIDRDTERSPATIGWKLRRRHGLRGWMPSCPSPSSSPASARLWSAYSTARSRISRIRRRKRRK